MKNVKGMIGYILVTLLAGLICIWLGVDTFTREPSVVRWLGLIMVFAGVGLFFRAWVLGSALHFEVAGKEAWWAIKKFLPSRYTQ
ncbi:hypothetical protein LCGC14_0282750 [marine sediment metagenome]|uniref:Uncharacterized protein n=1 Tax=marine sediment metagenome TaxID=412755 RepID=A0A0F9WGS1_9ZZZZ